MNLKIVALFFLVLLLINCGSDNQLQNRFHSDLKEYLDAYNKTDWGKVTSMIYPKYFRAVSKNQIIRTLAALDSMGMKRNFTLKNIERISEIVISGSEKYCRVWYNALIKISLNKLQMDNLAKFKEDFGKENVLFEEKFTRFTINALQSVIAITDKDSDNWKYVELNNEHAIDRVSLVVPAEVMKKLEK